MWTFYKANKMRSCSQQSVLFSTGKGKTGKKFRWGSSNREETKTGSSCTGGCFSRRKAMAFNDWGGLFCWEMKLEKNDQDGCLEIGAGGRVWFRRSKVLSNGNRRHIRTWLGCPGYLVWLRQETRWRKKCLGGEKMKTFSPVGFQCFKPLSTFFVYQLKAMMIWPQDNLKLISGNRRNSSLTEAGGWAVLHVSLFTACAVEEVKVQSSLLDCCCISLELYIEGYGLCSWTLFLPLCSFLSLCFPLEQTFSRRR